MKEIRITCTGSDYISYKELLPLQGNIKSLPIFAGIEQIQTQQNPGGLTEEYISSGTYTKSFYTVMINPSAVKIFLMGISYKRYHHLINWEYAVPKILRNASEVKP